MARIYKRSAYAESDSPKSIGRESIVEETLPSPRTIPRSWPGANTIASSEGAVCGLPVTLPARPAPKIVAREPGNRLLCTCHAPIALTQRPVTLALEPPPPSGRIGGRCDEFPEVLPICHGATSAAPSVHPGFLLPCACMVAARACKRASVCRSSNGTGSRRRQFACSSVVPGRLG